jgi:hypothetical protein
MSVSVFTTVTAAGSRPRPYTRRAATNR